MPNDFSKQSQTPFLNSHRAGSQQPGDFAYWGIGTANQLIHRPFINQSAKQLIAGGRACAGEYAQQVSALPTVLDTYIRDELTDTLDTILLT